MKGIGRDVCKGRNAWWVENESHAKKDLGPSPRLLHDFNLHCKGIVGVPLETPQFIEG